MPTYSLGAANIVRMDRINDTAARATSAPRRGRRPFALLLAALVFAGCGAGTAKAQLSGGSTTVTVTLKSLKFTPNKVTIKPNTKVNFVWKESVAHNVVFDNKGPKSPTMNKGTWSPPTKTFAKPGTYKYKCTLHPGMNGQITVK